VKYLAANFGPDKGDNDSKPSATKKININTATAAELTDVLELSQRDASAIVQHRTEKGDFKDWSDLRKVPDIDLKRLQEQKERILFTPVRNAAGNQK
jgi:competence protein ComEA